MTSKEVETVHLSELVKLLDESGIVCNRSPAESVETESQILEEEHDSAEHRVNATPEEVIEESRRPPSLAEEEEALPFIFPTPSLRKILPERIRKAEDHNRLHVLPDEFNTDVDPLAIPKIVQTPPQKYIEILADIVGCQMYKSNLAEYWFLDTLANLLRRAQEDFLDKTTQAVLILWFCEWMKEIQHFDAADRTRMLTRFQDNMLSAARYVVDKNRLPTPADVGVYYKEPDDSVPGKPSKVFDGVPATESKHWVTFESSAYECYMTDLVKIIHYIFDLFSTDFQYDLVRSVFTHTPQYTLIDAPYQIQVPKQLFGKSKKDKSPKKEKSPKTPAKGKVKEELNIEYMALMELKAREEKELEELEEMEREEWARKSQILPLTMAAGEELFNKYWPSPVIETEPPATPTQDVKAAKSKNKMK